MNNKHISMLQNQLEKVTKERDFLQKVVDKTNIILAVNTANNPNEIIYWNNARYKEVMGFDHNEVNANPSIFFEGIHPDDVKFISDSFQGFMEEDGKNEIIDKDIQMTTVYRHKNAKGEYRWLYINAICFDYDENDVMKHMLISCIDMTERIKREKSLEEMLKRNVQLKYKEAISQMTEREKEIVRLIAQGNSNETISEQLFISYNTVRTHRRNIMQKMGWKATSEMVSFAKDAGLF